MVLHTARCLLIQTRQDFNRDRLPWLPSRLYRLLSEVGPKG